MLLYLRSGLAIHKSAETFAIGVKLVNTNISSRKWVWLMLTYSGITPFGIVTGDFPPSFHSLESHLAEVLLRLCAQVS